MKELSTLIHQISFFFFKNKSLQKVVVLSLEHLCSSRLRFDLFSLQDIRTRLQMREVFSSICIRSLVNSG